MFKFEEIIIQADESPKEYAFDNIITEQKMSMLDYGCYAEVYANDTAPYVVKLAVGHDTGYRAWVNALMHLGNPNNPYLPKIHKSLLIRHADDHHKYRDHNRKPGFHPSDRFVVFIEKLKHNAGRRAYNYANMLSVMSQKKLGVDTFWHKRPMNLDRLKKNREELLILMELAANTPDVHKNKHRIDLHSHNYMMRGHQVVVTDPIAVN